MKNDDGCMMCVVVVFLAAGGYLVKSAKMGHVLVNDL